MTKDQKIRYDLFVESLNHPVQRPCDGSDKDCVDEDVICNGICEHSETEALIGRTTTQDQKIAENCWRYGDEEDYE